MIKRQRAVFIAALLVCLLAGFTAGVYVGKSRGIPFMTMQGEWSIGIYTGDSPLNLTPAENINPS
ncbi:MAG: hypothetical protein GXP46_06380 [Deferribacteres bacterium]|nr:hypothetical protein [Deferribacteres bacterium]